MSRPPTTTAPSRRSSRSPTPATRSPFAGSGQRNSGPGRISDRGFSSAATPAPARRTSRWRSSGRSSGATARKTALFLNVPAWLNALRESYGDGEPPPNPDGYDLVVLDDLGAENWSSWARDRIYNLVNQREQQRGLVIVTTNYDWGDLAGRVGGPTASRLRRLAREVHVDARDDFRERDAA